VLVTRTRAFVQALAEQLAADPRYRAELGREAVQWLARSAPLHDIGKVGVPDAVLLKPGRLTEREFEVMKRHAPMGRRMLERAESAAPPGVPVTFLRVAGEMAGGHHERWDGTGYPSGLREKGIPLAARLMAVANVYDALRSRRPYKPPMTHEESVAVIAADSGASFDPDVVQAFLAVEKRFAEISQRYADEDAGSGPHHG
jgi:putative two-component system response regulator